MHELEKGGRELTRLLDVNEVAEILGLSAATVRRYVKAGKLKAFYKGAGGKMKFPPDEVEKFINENLK